MCGVERYDNYSWPVCSESTCTKHGRRTLATNLATIFNMNASQKFPSCAEALHESTGHSARSRDWPFCDLLFLRATLLCDLGTLNLQRLVGHLPSVRITEFLQGC